MINSIQQAFNKHFNPQLYLDSQENSSQSSKIFLLYVFSLIFIKQLFPLFIEIKLHSINFLISISYNDNSQFFDWPKHKRYPMISQEQPQKSVQPYPDIKIEHLTLTRNQNYQQPIVKKYLDHEKAIKCLQQAVALSRTESGCETLYQISQYWMSSLFEALQEKLMGSEADRLHFQLIVNLLKYEKFQASAIKYKEVMEGYRNYAYGQQFRKQANIVADMLQSITEKAIKKEQEQASKTEQKYRSTFSSIEDAQNYLKEQKDWCSFLYNNILFQHNYAAYIRMLVGAARAGAIAQVVRIYPQDCFCCAFYNIVKWSLFSKDIQQEIELLGLLFATKDSQKMKRYYQEMESIARTASRSGGWSLTDRNKIVCIDLKKNMRCFKKGLLRDELLPPSLMAFGNKIELNRFYLEAKGKRTKQQQQLQLEKQKYKQKQKKEQKEKQSEQQTSKLTKDKQEKNQQTQPNKVKQNSPPEQQPSQYS